MRWASRFLTVLAISSAVPVLASEPGTVSDRAAAREAYVSGDYARSKEMLDALLALSPDDPDLLRRKAAVHAAMGDLAGAQETIDRAIRLAPADGDIQLARAYILLWSEDLGAARLQAQQLTATRPNYPGLGEFDGALERAAEKRGLKLRSLHAGSSVASAEFAAGHGQYWTTQRAALAVGWASKSGASVAIEREERDQIDTRVHGRVDLGLGSERIFLTAGVTPDPDFRSAWSIGVGGEIARGEDGHFLVEASFADYRRGENVASFGAGYRHRFSPELAASARTLHLFGGGETYRLGAVLRADYTPAGHPDLFALVASYPDTEIDGTRTLKAIAAGAVIEVTDHLQLRLTGEFEDREASYTRTAVGLDLSWHFGGQ